MGDKTLANVRRQKQKCTVWIVLQLKLCANRNEFHDYCARCEFGANSAKTLCHCASHVPQTSAAAATVVAVANNQRRLFDQFARGNIIKVDANSATRRSNAQNRHTYISHSATAKNRFFAKNIRENSAEMCHASIRRRWPNSVFEFMVGQMQWRCWKWVLRNDACHKSQAQLIEMCQ